MKSQWFKTFNSRKDYPYKRNILRCFFERIFQHEQNVKKNK